MSTLTPPVPLEKPENQVRVDWIQDCATGPDFSYPPEFYDHTEALWADKGVQVNKIIVTYFLFIGIMNCCFLNSTDL